MKLLICCFLLALTVLCVESMVWCGYLQCTKDCDEDLRVGNCQTCKCTCGNSTCMENYYCLYGIVSYDDPLSRPKCCSSAGNSPDVVCLLPGETNFANALPNFS